MNSCEAFDRKTGKWKQIASMRNGRYAQAVSAIEGKLYVFGGITTGINVLTSVECYDPIKNSWTPTTPLPVDRRAHGKSNNEDI